MKMKKGRLCISMLCLVTVFLLFSIQTLAAVPVDLEKECQLVVQFTPEGIKASGVEFKAYKVASLSASYEFFVEPKFKSSDITELIKNPTEENYRIMTSVLYGMILSDDTIQEDSTAISDSFGRTTFENLEVGLYLIVGGMYPTDGGLYKPQSFMVSFPERTERDEWNYHIVAEAKWTKLLSGSRTNVNILKVWDDSDTNFHTNDSVKVYLYKNGELYDTQILNTKNHWRFQWKDLDGESFWTVKEENITGYTGTVERKGDTFVITNTPKKPNKVPPVLPQTGLLRWPVPFLVAGGTLLIFIGIYLKRKGEK